MRSKRMLVVLAVVAMVAISVPAAAFAGANGVGLGLGNQDDSSESDDTRGEAEHRAPTGQQLATILRVTDDELGAEVESAFFESTLEGANETERASILADRAAILRDRARTAMEARSNATNGYESGELTRSATAQRLAVTTAQANSIDRLFDRLNDHAENVSALDLRSAGFNRSANREVRDRLGELTGPGTMGLLNQFTGERTGSFSLELDGGVSIAIETEAGERSRELDRPHPGNGSFTINASEAIELARAALDGDVNGTWTLDSVERDDDGYYEIEFEFAGPRLTGEAEVDVDGETGTVFSFEEEFEPREDDEDDDDERLAVALVQGEPEAGATVTLRVTDGERPVAGATVEVDDGPTAVTNPAGRVTLTLPHAEETVEIEAEDGEREGELELSVRENTSDDDELRRNLEVTGTHENGTATLVVRYEGAGVPGLRTLVDDTLVGPTGPDGTVTFGVTGSEAPDVTLVRGDLVIEVDLELEDGRLTVDDLDIDDRDDDEGERENDDDDDGVV